MKMRTLEKRKDLIDRKQNKVDQIKPNEDDNKWSKNYPGSIKTYFKIWFVIRYYLWIGFRWLSGLNLFE